MDCISQSLTGPFPYRTVGLRLGLVGMVLGFTFCAEVRGGKPEDASFDRDTKLTLLARQALQADRELAPHNLGVSVQDRAATLWGPVPSVALARRAEILLRNLAELVEVHNELHLDPTQDPGPTKSSPPRPREPSFQKTKPTGSAALTGFPRERAKVAVGQEEQRAPPDKKTLVLPPITIPTPAGARQSPADPVRGDQTRARKTAGGLTEALGQLRKRNPQFRSVQTEIRGRLVYVRGTAGQSEQVSQFAQAIAELPGVERVVLQTAIPPGSR
jgi:osmotically-inducible protein OsmY